MTSGLRERRARAARADRREGERPPTPAVFGPGTLSTLPDAIARLVTQHGALPRALVVFSPSSIGRPWRGRVLAGLHTFDPEAHEHPTGGPTPETVENVARAARERDTGVLVGIGGGGIVDAVKAAGAALRAESDGKLLVLAVPTTPGTGAEVTPFATLWDHERGRKRSTTGDIAPDLALIDPDLCEDLPQEVLTSSALDALTQGAEAAWSTHSTAESIASGLSAVALMSRAAEDLLGGSSLSPRARSLASLAGLHAGRAIAISETSACHAVSYPLTLWHGVRHGHACGLTLGPMLEYNASTTPEECRDPRGAEHVVSVTRRIAGALGASSVSKSRTTIDQIRSRGGLAGYADLSADSNALAAEALTYNRAANNPRDLDVPRLTALLKSLEHPNPC